MAPLWGLNNLIDASQNKFVWPKPKYRPKQLAIKVWSICDQIKLVKSGKNVFCSTINTFELKIWWTLNPNFWTPVWSWNFIFGQQILWPIVQSWKGFGYHRPRFWPFAPPYKPFPESIEKSDFSIFLPQHLHQSKSVVLVKVDPSQCPPNSLKQFLMYLLLDPLLALLKLWPPKSTPKPHPSTPPFRSIYLLNGSEL